MRIRSTKPEFWRSGRVASVSWDARLVLKGLESYVDDNGVGKYEMALIVGDLFSRDLVREPSRTLARVSEAISELNQAGLLWLYDADGTDLMFVAFWDSIQRVDKPQPGRFPRPDGTMNYRDSVIRESLANLREPSRALLPGTGEQGNRGTGEQISGSGSLVSRQGGDDVPPPEKCLRHINNPNPPSCGGCADARRARDAWKDERDRLRIEAEKSAEAERLRRRAQIDNCPHCDDFGRLDDLTDCTHTEERHA
ncbi:hypothetical protein [Mycolicibacter kumamotonensis]|uniref:hypothetical protein n=1 Tax=Mycolicibacter kumamotonensis TaxID=354243 RepID=UPI001A983DDF|nr:hypothetical protein [Mycolicibacter kumamotonensis]